jgi:hypothetical protein
MSERWADAARSELTVANILTGGEKSPVWPTGTSSGWAAARST